MNKIFYPIFGVRVNAPSALNPDRDHETLVHYEPDAPVSFVALKGGRLKDSEHDYPVINFKTYAEAKEAVESLLRELIEHYEVK